MQRMSQRVRKAGGVGVAWMAMMLAPPAAQALCLGDAATLATVQASKAGGFVDDDNSRRNARALALLDCLGDPDPAIRDGLAYEALTAWLRAGALETDTRRAMLQRLSGELDASGADDAGLRQPFAALVLSEIARSERIAPWMTAVERNNLVELASRYLETLRDYRGFDTHEGWRHGVAHGADLLMQLAMIPSLQSAQLQRILAAVASQMPPPAAHFYIYGEPQRLLRPLIFVAQRGVLDEAAWTAWFGARVEAIGTDSDTVWRDQAWLARRHAVLVFLQAAYVETDASADARLAPMRAGALAALKAMP